jgi:multidrug efflux pump subunit AcrA (membrane-fusion protein)
MRTALVLLVGLGISIARMSATGAAPKNEADKPAAPEVVKIASERDGVLQFIGAEIAEGEKVPPDMVFTVKIGGVEKKFRRLKNGDSVKADQLLAQLDDRQARDDVTKYKTKLARAEADLAAAEEAAAEAKSRYETGLQLSKRVPMFKEELRVRKLTMEKYALEAKIRKKTTEVARLELAALETILSMHEIRSPANGVIKAILKKPGEAIRRNDAAFEIAVASAALPPHPLDAVFKDADTEKAVTEALLKSEIYKTAVKEALKAKKKVEEEHKKNPKLVGPTPDQAARVRFWEVLKAGKVEEEK